MTVSAPTRQLKQDDAKLNQRIRQRLKLNRILKYVLLGCTLVGLLVLAVLIIDTLVKGTSHLNLHFLTSFSSSTPSMAGIKGALVGTLWLMVTIIPISIILGVGTAIYLEEYARDNTFTRIIKISISNLAGVPSVVFGLLGLTIFVRGMGIEALGLGNSIIAAALTMSLLILPIIIVASQEAIRAVPQSMRDASYGLGATQWQTIRRVVLPAALPGILTGFILALSRALGRRHHSFSLVSQLSYCRYHLVYSIDFKLYQCRFITGRNYRKLNSRTSLQPELSSCSSSYC